MAPLTNPEAALLGLLSESDKHAYQLEKDVEYRDMRYWTDLSMSSIYKLLRKLEKSGMVGARSEISEENRARKIYHLTEGGLGALRSHVRGLLTAVEHRKWPLHIALNNLHLLDIEEARADLTAYRDALAKQISGYRDLDAFLVGEDCPAHRLNLARHPIYVLEGELRWVEDYLADLDRSGSIE